MFTYIRSNCYGDLNLYLKRLAINANANTITSFARELNPPGVGEYIYIYIYIYIYMGCNWLLSLVKIQRVLRNENYEFKPLYSNKKFISRYILLLTEGFSRYLFWRKNLYLRIFRWVRGCTCIPVLLKILVYSGKVWSRTSGRRSVAVNVQTKLWFTHVMWGLYNLERVSLGTVAVLYDNLKMILMSSNADKGIAVNFYKSSITWQELREKTQYLDRRRSKVYAWVSCPFEAVNLRWG